MARATRREAVRLLRTGNAEVRQPRLRGARTGTERPQPARRAFDSAISRMFFSTS